MHFRPTEETDYEQVFKLLRNTRLVKDDFSHEKFQRIVRRSYGLCFVAENDGVIIASAFCMSDGATVAYIRKVAVAEGFRREHIGSNLIRRVIEAVKDEGVSKVFVQVAHNNLASLAMMELLGFNGIADRYTLDKTL